ncbi:MAG: MlaC/ttg2D family ABC transporter substrate-binding protein, partial [Planctomycetota bacterium]
AIEPVLDWRRMGQSALGRHWRDRTDEERTEFAELFRKLLERTYWKRIRDNAEAEINYKDEDVDEEEGRAKVRLVAVASGEEEVPISYRLYRLSEEEMKEKKDAPVWLVYDVRVEGVSLIKNYRDQFNDVMVGGSFERLMKMLRKKVEENQ